MEKNCVSNEYKVKYYHLLPSFVPNDIHIFDGISDPCSSLAHLGVCPDILEIAPEPLTLTYGPNTEEVEEEIFEEINAFGGIGVKLF